MRVGDAGISLRFRPDGPKARPTIPPHPDPRLGTPACRQAGSVSHSFLIRGAAGSIPFQSKF